MLGAAALPAGLAVANWPHLLTLMVSVLVWLRTVFAFSVTASTTLVGSLLTASGAVLGSRVVLAACLGLLIFVIASGALLRRRVWLEVRK
jgi:hypothetical protein